MVGAPSKNMVVGKLLKVGNSLEVVSKFMGHKSVDVTMSHYWVSNIKDVTDNMINPFTGSYQEAETRTIDDNLELKLMYAKRDKCMEIIHTYNVIISECAKEKKSATDVQHMLFQQMPDLGTSCLSTSESNDDTSSFTNESNDDISSCSSVG